VLCGRDAATRRWCLWVEFFIWVCGRGFKAGVVRLCGVLCWSWWIGWGCWSRSDEHPSPFPGLTAQQETPSPSPPVPSTPRLAHSLPHPPSFILPQPIPPERPHTSELEPPLYLSTPRPSATPLTHSVCAPTHRKGAGHLTTFTLGTPHPLPQPHPPAEPNSTPPTLSLQQHPGQPTLHRTLPAPPPPRKGTQVHCLCLNTPTFDPTFLPFQKKQDLSSAFGIFFEKLLLPPPPPPSAAEI